VHTDGDQVSRLESDRSSPSMRLPPATPGSGNATDNNAPHWTDTSHAPAQIKSSDLKTTPQASDHSIQAQADQRSSPNRADDVSSSAPNRFVGDLNPEAVLLERTPGSNQSHAQRGDIGVWLDDPAQGKTANGGHAMDTGNLPQCPLDHGACTCASLNSKGLQASDRAALIGIYFSRIHPLFPILDETEFRHRLCDGNTPDTLIRAVCLVAAKDRRAEAHLSHPAILGLMTPRAFARAVYASILKDLRSDVQYDKINLIRILALISLHSEGPDGAEEASMHLAQAIHYSQTIGIHLGRSCNSKELKSRNKLFWSLWSLDKLNAAINGRPVMISDHDLGIAAFKPKPQEDKGFEIWLKLAAMLNKVIALYRPTASPAATGWEEEFPGFEEIVGQSDEPLNSSILSTSQSNMLHSYAYFRSSDTASILLHCRNAVIEIEIHLRRSLLKVILHPTKSSRHANDNTHVRRCHARPSSSTTCTLRNLTSPLDSVQTYASEPTSSSTGTGKVRFQTVLPDT
jgi:hypothetical protein